MEILVCYVVADVANLPFRSGVFDGVVSLHTLHHLPQDDQKTAYGELYRVLASGSSAVVVNGWTKSAFMKRTQWLVNLMERLGSRLARRRAASAGETTNEKKTARAQSAEPTGTYIHKQDARWLRQQLQGMEFEIRCWRSVNVRFLRAVIHSSLGGRFWLRLLYWFEDRFPHYFGEKGQYPLVVIRKDSHG